jgi:NDP-sugar pyrophosphorylase family protein
MHVDEAEARVVEFNKKPTLATGWVSGGFVLFLREFAERYLDDEPDLLLEKAPSQQVARDGQLGIYQHEGFGAGTDTFRDWTDLNRRWDRGDAVGGFGRTNDWGEHGGGGSHREDVPGSSITNGCCVWAPGSVGQLPDIRCLRRFAGCA